MTIKPLLAFLVAGLLLTGCTDRLTERVNKDAAAREAVGSTLRNDSDQPIAYSPAGTSAELMLAPHSEVTNAGGAWAVEIGQVCSYRVKGDTVDRQAVGNAPYRVWTTFGGYRETIHRCAPVSTQ